MPDVIYVLSAETWDRLHAEVIEDGEPVARVDRERQHLLYSIEYGPVMVFVNVGFARRAA